LYVICVVPSDCLVVPTFDADRPPATVGLPVVVTGAQWIAQSPEQLLVVPVSFSNR
jgi:hypothetical protein